jgi:hypothetical protein
MTLPSREDRIASGELCRVCGDWANILRPPGHPATCHDCQRLTDAEPLRHKHFLRCPKCANHWDLTAPDYPLIGSDHILGMIWCGEGVDVTCPTCEHKFHVETLMEITFTSPRLGNLKGREDDEDEDEDEDEDDEG